jgi:hypothetical protein
MLVKLLVEILNTLLSLATANSLNIYEVVAQSTQHRIEKSSTGAAPPKKNKNACCT